MDRFDQILSPLGFGLCFAIPIVLAIVFALWQPDWMKPEWLVWLQQNHSGVISLLREDLMHNRRGAAFKAWKRRVSTQQGFEAWVEEVRREHGV